MADLKCEGKEPSETDKLIIDVIGVIKMSMQSFIKLVGFGSKSDDLHGARRTRRRTSSAVTQIRFSWYQEDSAQASVSQRGRESE